MKTWQGVVFGVVIGLLGTGLILLISSRPHGEPVVLNPPPTQSLMIIHITGAVIQPGVYHLPANSRINDAIQAAGGLSSDADSNQVNLAAQLRDGERVMIPAIGQPTPSVKTPSDSLPGSSSDIAPADRVNINTATQEELEILPGVGPSRAQDIIAYRQENGPFISVEDLDNVPGIGPTIIETLKDLITVLDQP